MLTLCRQILYLYPRAYRVVFEEEMLAVLRERQMETREQSAWRQWALSAKEAGGLMFGAVQEQLRGVTGSFPWAVNPIRRFGMRTEFRFPKATPVLMMVILAAVVMAIEKATTISPGLPPKFTILSDLVLVFVGGLLVGAACWAILFALRRSGLHRLEGLRPSGKASSGGSLVG